VYVQAVAHHHHNQRNGPFSYLGVLQRQHGHQLPLPTNQWKNIIGMMIIIFEMMMMMMMMIVTTRRSWTMIIIISIIMIIIIIIIITTMMILLNSLYIYMCILLLSAVRP